MNTDPTRFPDGLPLTRSINGDIQPVLTVRLGDMVGTPRNDSPVLLCPNCGEGWLHHEDVEVWDRGEDAVFGNHVVISDDVYINHIVSHESGNPSSRRSEVQIAFTCETCPANVFLNIVQHKGNTFLEWEEFATEDFPAEVEEG